MSKAGQMVLAEANKEEVAEVTFDSAAHKQLHAGAEVVYKAVKSTMGPSGHNVIIDSGRCAPLITKDGVTVARSIHLRDKLQSVGAELIKEVASKTNELGGDGTTTATVIAYSMLHTGLKMAASGHSSIALKRGMEWGTAKVIEWLKEHALPVSDSKDIIDVGTISANGDRSIGELLNEAINRVGQDGIITIEPAKSINTTLEVVEGLMFECGYVSPYFVNNQEKLTCELHDVHVLVSNKKITAMQEIVPAMEIAAKSSKPLLIIADEIEGEALHTLLVNKMKGILSAVAVKAPSYGDNRADILSDIGLVTGGRVFDASSEKALKSVTPGDLGYAKRVIVSKTSTTIIGRESDTEKKNTIAERVQQLRALLATDGIDDMKRENTKRRLAKLAGGIAVVKVGGSTEVEILEKKDRVEDALNATLAAVQEGILPGGGTALFYASEWLQKRALQGSGLTEDELAGVRVVVEACRCPLKVIVENTGASPEVVMNELRTKGEGSFGKLLEKMLGKSFGLVTEQDVMDLLRLKLRTGYDASRHVYCDLIEQGILDPLKVERLALEHSCSVIGLVLTTNCVVLIDTAEG
jgi:chaperonin GroEL